MLTPKNINSEQIKRTYSKRLSVPGWAVDLAMVLLAAVLAALFLGGIRLVAAEQIEGPIDGAGIMAAPTAVDDGYSVNEDTILSINPAQSLLINDTDPENDKLTAILVTDVTHGELNLNTNGSFNYTPLTNYVGQDTFTYVANDGTENSNNATVTITINQVNDLPVAGDDVFTVDEDSGPTDLDVLINDTDPDPLDDLYVLDVTTPANGTVVNHTSYVTYTPDLNFHGDDIFNYIVSDGNGGSDQATVTIHVTPMEDLPIAALDTSTTPEDTPIIINVMGNDVLGDTPTTITAVTQGTLGGVVNNISTVTYNPSPNLYGEDAFTYTITDSDGDISEATVNITITPVDEPLDAVDDTAVTPEESPIIIDVLLNDLPGDLPTTITATSNGAHGTVQNNGSDVTYTPVSNYFGTDTFTYTITDSNGDQDTASVDVTVTAVDDTLTAEDDTSSTAEDTAVNIYVMSNDVLGDQPTTITSVTQGTHGTVVNHTSYLTYTPALNYDSTDSFNYTITDFDGDPSEATVTVTVNPINDPPVALNDSYTVAEDTTLSKATRAEGVLNNDTDIEGTTLIVQSGDDNLVRPEHGVLILGSDGAFSYDPEDNFFGTDTFQYKADDGLLASEFATVTINVTAVDDSPVALNDPRSVPEDSVNVDLTVLLNDNFGGDGPGAIPLEITDGPDHGSATVDQNGTPNNPVDDKILYSPALNYNGPDSLTYQICDAVSPVQTCVQAVVSITVTAVNDLPVAVADSYTLNTRTMTGEKTLEINLTGLLANDVDPDNNLQAIKVSDPSYGDVVINPDGSFTYTADELFDGQVDTFMYRATEVGGGGSSAPVTVTITVDLVKPPEIPVWVQPIPTYKPFYPPYPEYSSGEILLEASINEFDDFGYIEFVRWDFILNDWVVIGTDNTAPYTSILQVTDLRLENDGINELFIRAYDLHGNYVPHDVTEERQLLVRVVHFDFSLYLPMILK